MNKILVFFLLLLCFNSCKSTPEKASPETLISARPEIEFPNAVGYVNDFSQLFTAEQVKDLNNILTDYDKETSNEMVVVTVNTIEPYDEIKYYATDLANHWGVGKEGKQNGLLILVHYYERNIWISTGIETEKVLTNQIVESTIDSIIIPEFKKGDYYEGIVSGINNLIEKWN